MHIRLSMYEDSEQRILIPVEGTVFSEVKSYSANYTVAETAKGKYKVYESLEMIQQLIADGERCVLQGTGGVDGHRIPTEGE